MEPKESPNLSGLGINKDNKGAPLSSAQRLNARKAVWMASPYEGHPPYLGILSSSFSTLRGRYYNYYANDFYQQQHQHCHLLHHQQHHRYRDLFPEQHRYFSERFHLPSHFPDVFNARVKNAPSTTPETKSEARAVLMLRDHEWLLHGASGAGAGTITALATQPLDVTKTLLQIQKQSHVGTFGTLRNVFLNEGVRGCYRGLGTTTMALVPQWGVYFCMYSHFNSIAYNFFGFQDTPYVHVMSATTASLITDVSVSPLWMVKTRLQTQALGLAKNQKRYTSTVNAFRTIAREEGPRALYQGLTAQILGISQYAIQFPLYEKMKSWLAARDSKSKSQLSPWEVVCASSVSKFSACLLTYPHEVLRTRFQHQIASDPQAYKTLGEAVRRIFREEGIRGFYRGLGTTLLRVTPSAAITFTTYEILLRYFQTKMGLVE